jgi:hypothetical protein
MRKVPLEIQPMEFLDVPEMTGDPLDAQPLRDGADSAPPQQTQRLATVDARNCNRLDYDDVMLGEVTVRWVWNGTKFVPHKVCVVEEENGVSSVWSFDRQDDAVLSEIPQDPN